MDFTTAAIVCVVGMLFLMLMGMPVIYALGFTALVVAFFAYGPLSLEKLGWTTFNTLYDINWTPLPLFILIACLIAETKIGEDIYEAARIDEEIQDKLQSFVYGTNNWIQMNRNLFSYIKVEKILMFLLLTLIILVAAFNLVGMLTMVIMEKRSEIGILRSMGASSRGIMSIFMIEGTMIGVIGTVMGVAAGLGLCAVLSSVKIDLPADVYFINTLPVVVQGLDIAIVSLASLLISFVATIYPSWEACRLMPLDVIRYD